MSTVAYVFFFSMLYYCLPILCSSAESDHANETLLEFYDEQGKVHHIDLTAPVEKQHVLNLTLNIVPTGNARFWLYSRANQNDYEELFISDIKSGTSFKSKYRADKKLILVTHGWLNNGLTKSSQLIKDAYLRAMDVNVVVVDWKNAALHIDYIKSAALTQVIGTQIKDFVLALAKRYSFGGNNIHLIGHSLGAHVMGIAGKQLAENQMKVARVTGLDPARPFFEIPRTFPAICKESAFFVDIIHTNRGVLGYFGDVGHADFFPNGGFLQPYCCSPPRITNCHHNCAFIYYERSIAETKYEARKCSSYWNYVIGLCGKNQIQLMGEPGSPAARGSHFLNIQ